METTTFKEVGRDGGKVVVEFQPSGERKLLTDDEFAALQGAPAVKKLSDEKEIKRLEAALSDMEGQRDRAITERDVAVGKLAPAEAAAAEWQERAEKAEATVAEQAAALAQKSKLGTPEAPVISDQGAEATVTPVDKPAKPLEVVDVSNPHGETATAEFVETSAEKPAKPSKKGK